MVGATVSARPAALQAHRALLAEPTARVQGALADLRARLRVLGPEEWDDLAAAGAVDPTDDLAAVLHEIVELDRWVGSVGDAFARLAPARSGVLHLPVSQIVAAIAPRPADHARHVAALVAAHRRIEGSPDRASAWLDELDALSGHDLRVAHDVLEAIGGRAFAALVPMLRDVDDPDLVLADASRVLASASRSGMSERFLTGLFHRADRSVEIRLELTALVRQGFFGEAFMVEFFRRVAAPEAAFRFGLGRWGAMPTAPPTVLFSGPTDILVLAAQALTRQPGIAAAVAASDLGDPVLAARHVERGSDLLASVVPTVDGGAAGARALQVAIQTARATAMTNSDGRPSADPMMASVVDRLIRGAGNQQQLVPPLMAVLLQFHVGDLLAQLDRVDAQGDDYTGRDRGLRGDVVDGKLDVTTRQVERILATGWTHPDAAFDLSRALTERAALDALAVMADGSPLDRRTPVPTLEAPLRIVTALHRESIAFLEGQHVYDTQAGEIARTRAFFGIDFVLGKLGAPIGLGAIDALSAQPSGEDAATRALIGAAGVVAVSHAVLGLAMQSGAVAPTNVPAQFRSGDRLLDRAALAGDAPLDKAFGDWIGDRDALLAAGIPPDVIEALGQIRADVRPGVHDYGVFVHQRG